MTFKELAGFSPAIRDLNCNCSHGNLYEQWAVLNAEQRASCMHIDFLLKMPEFLLLLLRSPTNLNLSRCLQSYWCIIIT